MALTRTIADLRSEALERADLRSVQVSPTVLDLFLNASLRRLYRLLTRACRDYFLTYSDVTVTLGTGTLPASFWRARLVQVDDNGQWRKLRRLGIAELKRDTGGTSSSSCDGYRIVGTTLQVFPATWAGTIRLWYLPAPPTITTGDTWDGICGWEDYAIVDTAIRLRVKFEEDFDELLVERRELQEEIESSLGSERDDHEPDRVRDVSAEDDSDGPIWAARQRA